MDADQWNDLADVIEFDLDRPSAVTAYDFLKPLVEGRGWTMSDLGSGPGVMSVKLSPLFREITMVDFSSNMLLRAAREAEARGITNLTTCLADLREYSPAERSDLAFACASPIFYRVQGARKMESLASKACALVVPTLDAGSPVRKVLELAGIGLEQNIDADLIIEDRSREHDVKWVKFAEERETLTPLVMKNRCLRYTDGSPESERRIEEAVSSLDEGDLWFQRFSKLMYWEL